jgi:LPXTG-motif cell wall-anchored protein
MKIRLIGLGLGSILTLAGVVVPSMTASADSTTCYIGCTPPPPSSHDGPPPVTKAVSVPSSALAFTGADIEEMTIIGGGALLAGGVLMRRSRRRNRPARS